MDEMIKIWHCFSFCYLTKPKNYFIPEIISFELRLTPSSLPKYPTKLAYKNFLLLYSKTAIVMISFFCFWINPLNLCLLLLLVLFFKNHPKIELTSQLFAFKTYFWMYTKYQRWMRTQRIKHAKCSNTKQAGKFIIIIIIIFEMQTNFLFGPHKQSVWMYDV